VVLAVLVVAAIVRGYVGTRGADRRARLVPLVAAVAVWGVLGFGAAARLAGRHVDPQVLFAYEVVLIASSALLLIDARYGRWSRSAITSLAVDLGHAGLLPLRDRLAEALGDPSLRVGYADPDGALRDESGQPVELGPQPPGRTVTILSDGGRMIAALIHDAAVLDDPVLLDSVSSLAKVTIGNARLQQEAQARHAAVEASRRRLVLAADAERARLEAELRAGAQNRLEHAVKILDDLPDHGGRLATQLVAGQESMRAFARGVHPRALTDAGLEAALAELAKTTSVPVTMSVPQRRFDPATEITAYFVCAEALTNIAKYAHATRAAMHLAVEHGELILDVRDDGVGGADPGSGTGLVGLRDRLDVLGGTLHVTSPTGQGTRIIARIPLPGTGYAGEVRAPRAPGVGAGSVC
jgi:signal transduction histidine kinase